MVCKVPMMDGARVYGLARVGHRHHHSVCVQCCVVGELEAAIVDRSFRAIAADISGQVVENHIELYVTCDDCPADRG